MKKTKTTTTNKSEKFHSNSTFRCPNCGNYCILEKTITPKAEINEYICNYCDYHENVIDSIPMIADGVNTTQTPYNSISYDMSFKPGKSFFVSKDMFSQTNEEI